MKTPTQKHLNKMAAAIAASRLSLRNRAKLSRNLLRRTRRATSLGIALP